MRFARAATPAEQKRIVGLADGAGGYFSGGGQRKSVFGVADKRGETVFRVTDARFMNCSAFCARAVTEGFRRGGARCRAALFINHARRDFVREMAVERGFKSAAFMA